jgi:translation initiation factor 2-alpha kinase 4
MMLELAQHIQVFLHKHDRPPVSLYGGATEGGGEEREGEGGERETAV